MKSGSLNFLELSGPVQACNEIAFNYLKITVELETKDEDENGKLYT
jgi:hypothetical protein